MTLSDPERRSAGSSTADFAVGVAIATIVLAVLTLRAAASVGERRATEVVGLVARLRSACAAHHRDTGRLALERAGHDAGARQLSHPQALAGWDGPYFEGPLFDAHNPFGGPLVLFDRARAGGTAPGFDVDGDGRLDVTAAANVLRLDGVPADEASEIDRRLDGALPGAWAEAGCVRYLEQEERLLILVYFDRAAQEDAASPPAGRRDGPS